MKRKEFLRLAVLAPLGSGILLSSCADKKQQKAGEAKKTFTCPMHPQVVQDKPGSCPICGMDLVLFDKSSTDSSITLSQSQQALANITILEAGNGSFSDTKRLNGRLAVNPERTVVVSSRTAGRIESLFFKQTGIFVRKGESVYKIYSEQLSSLQQEYVLANAQAKQFPADIRFASIEKAARQKLQLYDQSNKDIDQLTNGKKPDPFIVYRSPISGIISDLSVNEGQYLAEGSPVLRIEDYSSLWVEADLYPDESADIHKGQKVQVEITGSEDEPQQMTVDFVAPTLQDGGQILQLRGAVSNPGNKWQPGLQANIILPVNGQQKAITLPVDAVIRDAKGAHVWIEAKSGTFTARKVSLGMQNADRVEIIDGIKVGEKVVASGGYLLYSEYVLKKGQDPLALQKNNI